MRTPSRKAVVSAALGLILILGGVFWWRARFRAEPGPPSCGDRAHPTDGAWPNEPAGFTVLSDYDFGDAVPARNDGDPLGPSGWGVWRNTDGRGSRVSDRTAPLSGPYVFQFHYPVGFSSGSDPAMLECAFARRLPELYWGFWWKPSDPFESDASGVNKIAFLWTSTAGAHSTDLLYFDFSPHPWRIRAMDNLAEGGGPSAGQRREPNVNTSVIIPGRWHRVEIHVKYSTGGKANGILTWWVNGVLNGHHTDLKMSPDGGFDHAQFAPTYGGNTADRKRQHDYYWIDHVRLSHP